MSSSTDDELKPQDNVGPEKSDSAHAQGESLHLDSDNAPAEKNDDEPQATSHKSTEETGPKRSLAIIMVALGLATFLAALDVAIVTTALPTIAEHFDASQTTYSWIGSAYLLPYAALIPLWGKLSDIFGRKLALLGANAIFFVGSLIAALSINVGMLIAGRTIQGCGGGGLIVLVNITIGDLVSPRERGKYLGLMGMVFATAAAAGPILGAVFAEYASWRWCFYINLPCDGAAFMALLFFLKVHNPRTKFWDGIKAIDWLGNALITGGILMILLGLEFGGQTFPWDSATVICLIVFGVCTVGLFFLVEARFAKYPLLPIRLFTRWDTIALLVVVSTHGFAYVAATYYLPYYFQEVLEVSPIESALRFLPYALVMAALAILTGHIIRKTGRYQEVIIIGIGLATLGFGLFIDFPAYQSWPRIIIFQIVAALGLGPNFQAPLIAMQSKYKAADIATATAAFGLTRNLSSAMSVIIGSVILSNRLESNIPAFLAAGISESTAKTLASGTSGATSLIQSLTPAQQEVVRQATAKSESDMWIFYTCLLAVGFICTFFIGNVALSTTHEEHKTGLATEEENRQANEKRGKRGGSEV